MHVKVGSASFPRVHSCTQVVFMLLVGALLGSLQMEASQGPSSVADCAVSVTPLKDIINVTDREKYAWLDLVTEETYDSAKTAIKASADVDLLDLIKVGDAEADYSTFNERRRKYLEKHQGTYDKDLAVSIYTQHLPKEAHEKWLECVKTVSHQAGLFAWFEEDTQDTARLVLRYYGAPGTQVEAVVTAVGTPTKLDKNYTLVHDGRTGILLGRQDQSAIIVNVNGGNLTAGAASAYPSSAGEFTLYVSPFIITPQAAMLCPKDSRDRCSFCMKNFTSVVDMSKAVPVGAALLPRAGAGGTAAPGNGPLNFQLDRGLDDIRLTGPARLQVQISGATATIAAVGAKESGCSNPKLEFPGSKVVARYPEPKYDWITSGPFTTQVLLRRGIEYQWVEGNIGCPNCGDLYGAEVRLREGDHALPVAYFESISPLSQKNSGHWYSCTDGKCGSNGDFTETGNKRSAQCFGKPTCWVWRHTDDAMGAEDTFSVTYFRRDRKCVKNCPASEQTPVLLQ